MAKYNLKATVNYPETEVDTPDLDNLQLHQVGLVINRLLLEETDATSFVITLVKIEQYHDQNS